MKKVLTIVTLFLCTILLSTSMPVVNAEDTATNGQTQNSTANDQTQDSTVWQTKKGKTYCYIDGVKQTGWKKIDGNKYYFDSKGVMKTGWQTINDKKYYFNESGVMQTGFQTIKKKTYYFNKKGVMQTGLTKVGSSKYYFDNKGRMKTGWKTVNSKKYYFDSAGTMTTGFQEIKGKTYYFNKQGVMQTGLTKVGSKKYFFDSKGRMKTGIKTINKKKYYFDSTGAMQTGFQEINGKTYYFNKSGVMQTGLTKVGSKKYFFDTKGRMKTGWKTISKNKYYFDSDGTMHTGWLTLNDLKYYFKSTGKMVKNTSVKIGGVYYTFNSKGVCESESYLMVNGVKVHAQYKTDPQVSTEQLLATIIYCEAGNQKQYPVTGKINSSSVTVYKGQLAVGYVIANRLKSNMSYKEVIYQFNQFEPARTGVLTKYLNNYGLVSTECKNAAKIILNDFNNNENSVADFKRSTFTWKNFWALSYANKTNFFRVYSESEYEVIQGHVFFNYTKTISK
ncbi:glucan-binding repeat-containing protein [Lachnotalea glycerini]|uniref:Glucan-binding repeat-containing protein n=1 Tax=Lachnotalea glycerini TaxID=1763509 RepID=A0A318ERJ5_9FIRM|nr:cell wall hydrolase [Lachnotalea glycerini]PXV85577.1 glucan-binding repeat-containing protein [Lachnotalea glycerini]